MTINQDQITPFLTEEKNGEGAKLPALPLLVQRLILRFQPLRGMPVWSRYVVTTVTIMALFGLHLFLQRFMFYSPYLLFLPGVILASLFLDRGTGLFAVVLSGTLTFYFFIHHYTVGRFISLGLYLSIGIFTASVIEALRVSLITLGKLISDLEESNGRLDDFVYIVSHDLKEPVRGINSFASFLLEDHGERLGAEGEEKLNKIKSSASHMNELISDLLTYCKSTKDETGREAIALDDTLNKIIELIKIQDEENDIAISVPHPLPKVYCNKAHLAEIFRNLITNAIKYNNNHPKRIEVGSLRGHERYPRGYVFFVKDNGIGIPEEHKETVFKIFKRLHGKGKYGGGTGAGLAIVKKLIEQQNGEIWIESNEEGGSTFYFYVDCA